MICKPDTRSLIEIIVDMKNHILHDQDTKPRLNILIVKKKGKCWCGSTRFMKAVNGE